MTLGHVLLCGPAEPSQVIDSSGLDELPLGLGGVPVNLLARALAARGWRVTVLSTSPHVAEPWRHREGAIEVVLVPMRRRARERALDLFSLERRALVHEIRRQRPGVVHAHWTYEFALAALASGVPTLVTAHDAPLSILRYHRDAYRVARTAMALWVRAKRPPLTVVSPYLAERWRTELCWQHEVAVIPNIAPFAGSSEAHIPSFGNRVAVIADSSERKNVRSAVRAWPQVLGEYADAELHLVGHGLGPFDKLATWARRQGFDRMIHWHGPLDRTELKNLLGSMCVLLHPSLEEAQPMVLLEAMALGRAIVAGQASGGVPWTVGEAALLTDVSSATAIATAVVDLLADTERRLELGRAGRRRVEQVFSEDAVAGAYEREYARVLM